MSMADFDQDGDLDIVVNNLNSAAQLFENQLCPEGASLELDLRWPGTADPFAIGATATLTTDKGVLLRDVRAVSGYLAGDATRLHFGAPPIAVLDRLEIRWPDERGLDGEGAGGGAVVDGDAGVKIWVNLPEYIMDTDARDLRIRNSANPAHPCPFHYAGPKIDTYKARQNYANSNP